MHSLVDSAVEELQSPVPVHCHGCVELRAQLKRALMQYLVSASYVYMCSPDSASPALDSELARSLAEFQGHRKDTHFVECYSPRWQAFEMRRVS